MKRYKFEIVIEEGNDEFWEDLEGKTGCDEVLEIVEEMFSEFDGSIRLVEYTDV